MLNLTFSKDEFVSLLEKLIGQVENLQNCPPDHIPKEELAADIVIDYLKPYSTELGGPLIVRKCTYVPSRSNLVLEYPGKLNNQSVVSFVGSHLDVVPAVPHEWDFDPFRLTRDGDDVLRGRGVTDCLGHVAMIAVFFKQLAIKKPNLKRSVKAIFIASEENSSIPGVGIEEMQVRGELESFKNGPLFWGKNLNFWGCDVETC
jgi:acetylornithine deacetylase